MTDDSNIQKLIEQVDRRIKEEEEAISSSSLSSFGTDKKYILIIILCGCLLLFILVFYFVAPHVRQWMRMRTSKQQGKVVKLSDLSPEQARFELFYQDWCLTCKKLKPALAEYTALRSGPDFRLVLHNCEIDCEENADCDLYHRIPVLRYKKNETSTPIIYRGPASAEEIERWVNELLAHKGKAV